MNDFSEAERLKAFKKKFFKYYIGVAFSLVALTFSIFAWLWPEISVAWFSANKAVNANGLSVSSKPNSIETNVKIHKLLGRNTVTTDGQTYYEYYFDTVSSDTTVGLPSYSALDDVSRYLLIEINVTDKEGETGEKVTLTAETLTDYFMDADHPLVGSDDGMSNGKCNCGKHDTYGNSLANISCFALLTSEKVESVNGEVTLGELADGVTANIYTSTYKLSSNNKDMTKEFNMITLIDADENKITSSAEIGDFSVTADNGTTIFILVSYDVMNINRVYSENIGNEVFKSDPSAGSKPIAFVPDVSFGLRYEEETANETDAPAQ